MNLTAPPCKRGTFIRPISHSGDPRLREGQACHLRVLRGCLWLEEAPRLCGRNAGVSDPDQQMVCWPGAGAQSMLPCGQWEDGAPNRGGSNLVERIPSFLPEIGLRMARWRATTSKGQHAYYKDTLTARQIVQIPHPRAPAHLLRSLSLTPQDPPRRPPATSCRSPRAEPAPRPPGARSQWPCRLMR